MAATTPRGNVLRLLNSTTGTKSVFSPANRGRVTWYGCGPTVYDATHLGHARTYVSFDILRRVLERRFGLHVRHVLGMTDVDDKIVARAAADGVPPLELARKWEAAFVRDMDALGVQRPMAVTRVSEHIPEIVDFVQVLLDRGFAYATEAGYERAAFGRASEPSVAVDAAGKRHSRDFALWKAQPSDATLAWPSPWGSGRPGWHIECSAFAKSMFGDELDLHTGGIDLQFPHHANEVVQCDAHSGCPGSEWVRHFVHSGHLHIEGRKMSKSLKNFISVADFLADGGRDAAVRFRLFAALHKYNSNLTYSADRMQDAGAVAETIRSFVQQLSALLEPTQTECKWRAADWAVARMLDDAEATVDEALADDLDTPRVLKTLTDAMGSVTRVLAEGHRPPPELAGHVLAAVARPLGDLGLGELVADGRTASAGATSAADGPDGVATADALVALRERLRALKHRDLYPLCDELRDETFPRLGIAVQDGKHGSTWRAVEPRRE